MSQNQQEESQPCEETDHKTKVLSGLYSQGKNRVFGWWSYALYNVGIGRGQRRSRSLVRQKGPQQPSQEQDKPSPEQDMPCCLSEQELEQLRDTMQGQAQQRNNFFTSAASVRSNCDFNSILLMMQVLCSSKYLYGSWKLVFGEVDTLLVDL